MTDILLQNAAILDVEAAVVRDACDVLIIGGRIAEIGTPRVAGSLAAEARHLDLSGRVLMPGLCDAHVHVIVPINSFAALTKWSPFYTAIRAMPILEGMLMRGFTTVRDCGGADFGLAKAVEEGLIPGPRILFSGKALSQSGGHGDMRGPGELPYDDHPGVPALGRICDGVPAVRAAARDELRRGAHQLKIMAGGGIASYTDPVTNDQFSRDEIAAAVEEAAHVGQVRRGPRIHRALDHPLRRAGRAIDRARQLHGRRHGEADGRAAGHLRADAGRAGRDGARGTAGGDAAGAARQDRFRASRRVALPRGRGAAWREDGVSAPI